MGGGSVEHIDNTLTPRKRLFIVLVERDGTQYRSY